MAGKHPVPALLRTGMQTGLVFLYTEGSRNERVKGDLSDLCRKSAIKCIFRDCTQFAFFQIENLST